MPPRTRHNPGEDTGAVTEFGIDQDYLEQVIRVGKRARNSEAFVFQTATDAMADLREIRQRTHSIVERAREQLERDDRRQE